MRAAATVNSFELQQVIVRFDDRTVLDVESFTAGPGEVVAVLGPSGAGKSTLLNLAAGVIGPTSGDATTLGHAMRPGNDLPREFRSRIGHMSQSLDLVGPLLAWRNVALGTAGSRSAWESSVQLARRVPPSSVSVVMEDLGLAPLVRERVEVLSGGEQQRVALARLLVQDPQFLICDEPVSSLDPQWSTVVLEALGKRAEAGATCLLSLHEPERAFAVATRIVGLRSGRVVFDLATEKVDEAMLAELYE